MHRDIEDAFELRDFLTGERLRGLQLRRKRAYISVEVEDCYPELLAHLALLFLITDELQGNAEGRKGF